MKKMSETIVFFGSGPVAAASLQRLSQSFAIEAVITKPRPTHHKGAVPVIETAEQLGQQLYTVSNRHELDQLIDLHSFQSKLGVLIDFGIIVSQAVIDSFPFGIVNSHFSLLPQWRGADPITFSVLSGDKQTGVSLMLLVQAMDEGPLLAVASYDMPTDITTPRLTNDLIYLSYSLLQNTLPAYIDGTVQAESQTAMARRFGYPEQASYSRKLTKDDGYLDWNKSAAQLEREVRAFAEWPKSRFQHGGLEIIVTRAHTAALSGKKPGTITRHDKLPAVYCADQALVIDRLKPAGKPEMDGGAFLAGYGAIWQ